MKDHIHRTPTMGENVLINDRWYNSKEASREGPRTKRKRLYPNPIGEVCKPVRPNWRYASMISYLEELTRAYCAL